MIGLILAHHGQLLQLVAFILSTVRQLGCQFTDALQYTGGGMHLEVFTGRVCRLTFKYVHQWPYHDVAASAASALRCGGLWLSPPDRFPPPWTMSPCLCCGETVFLWLPHRFCCRRRCRRYRSCCCCRGCGGHRLCSGCCGGSPYCYQHSAGWWAEQALHLPPRESCNGSCLYIEVLQ